MARGPLTQDLFGLLAQEGGDVEIFFGLYHELFSQAEVSAALLPLAAADERRHPGISRLLRHDGSRDRPFGFTFVFKGNNHRPGRHNRFISSKAQCVGFAEARCDDRNVDRIAHFFVDDRSEDDVGLVVSLILYRLRLRR